MVFQAATASSVDCETVLMVGTIVIGVFTVIAFILFFGVYTGLSDVLSVGHKTVGWGLPGLFLL